MKTNLILLAALSLVIFFSCNKNDDFNSVELDQEDIAAKETAVESSMSTVDYEIDYFSGSSDIMNSFASEVPTSSVKGNFKFKGVFGKVGFGDRYKIGKGPEVTIDKPEEANYPKTITIDYGTETETKHGIIISGKIIITVSAAPRTEGATKTISYENFVIDGKEVSGGSSRVFNAGEADGSGTITITGERVITFDDASISTRKVKKVKKWISGLDTKFNPSDDQLEITGETSVINSDNTQYKKAITKALKKIGECRYIVEGIVEISINGTVETTIDYGNGECDNIVTITKDGETKEVKIGNWKRKGKK